MILLPYASLVASRTLLQLLLACLNFNLDSKSLYCWYKRKNWFLWTMAAAAEVAENHEDEWGLTWYLKWGTMHQFQTESTQNSLAAAEASILNIFLYGTSPKWSCRPPHSAQRWAMQWQFQEIRYTRCWQHSFCFVWSSSFHCFNCV